MKTILSLLSICTFLCIISCQHDPLYVDTTGPNNPVDTTNQNEPNTLPCSKDTVYFENQILPIIQGNCAFSGCHGNGSAQDGVNLSNYSSIIKTGKVKPFNPKNSKLYESITEKKSDKIMPPPPQSKLTDTQIGLISTWIQQGALNNKCTSCDTINVTYSKIIAPIIQSACQGCHNATAPSGGIKLIDFNSIKAQVTNGKFLGSIYHSAGFVPMPYNQPKFNNCKINQIKIWIAAGALNN